MMLDIIFVVLRAIRYCSKIAKQEYVDSDDTIYNVIHDTGCVFVSGGGAPGKS
jgi:hypothetical protein